MLDRLTQSDGLPALERMMQFTGARHRVILNNIANLSTPGFRPMDVSPQAFQAQLAAAIDARRAGERAGWSNGAEEFDLPELPGLERGGAARMNAALSLPASREVEALPDRIILHPTPVGENIMFHDGNDRSVERVMQGLVENFMAFRASAQLLRSRLNTIAMAIRERI